MTAAIILFVVGAILLVLGIGRFGPLREYRAAAIIADIVGLILVSIALFQISSTGIFGV